MKHNFKFSAHTLTVNGKSWPVEYIPDPSGALLLFVTVDETEADNDGFTAFRLNDPLPLEPIPENAQPMDLDKIFPPLDEYMPVCIPSAGDLKVDHEMERAAHGKDAKNLHSFGPHLPTVNRAYLLDVFKVFPDAQFYVRKEYAARLVSPLYFASKDGDGVLLPIRTGEASRTKYSPEAFAREFAPAQ